MIYKVIMTHLIEFVTKVEAADENGAIELAREEINSTDINICGKEYEPEEVVPWTAYDDEEYPETELVKAA